MKSIDNVTDLMLDVRAFASRYGVIISDHKHELNGYHFRNTVYMVKGKQILVEMVNGVVVHLVYE